MRLAWGKLPIWMIGVSDNLHEQNSLQELLAVLMAVALNA